MIRRIRQSQLTQFRECRRKWSLEYVQGLELDRQPGQTKGARDLGTLVHKFAETYYAGGDWRETLQLEQLELKDLGAWSDEWLEHFTLAEIMFEGYVQWLASEAADAHKSVLFVEPQLEYPMGTFHGDEVILTGKPDLVLHDDIADIVEVVDTKTTGKMESAIIHGSQLKTYALLLKLVHGIDVGLGVTNQLRKVKRTARANPPFYQRAELFINEEMLRHHYSNIVGQLDEMVELMQYWEQEGMSDRTAYDRRFYPNPTALCPNRCDYLPICKALDAGGTGHEHIIRIHYRHKPETPHEETDSE